MLRAVLYSRVSTETQRDSNISLDDQLKAMRRYAQSQGWDIHSEVRETYSGVEEDRPRINQVRSLAKKKAFDILLVYRMDRFARDELVFQILERHFKRAGIRLFSVEDGEFTPGVINRYLSAIKRAQAAEEVETFKKRSREARKAYAVAGVPPGQSQAVYGYRKEGKKKDVRYVIDKKEADTVRMIYDMFVNDGISMQEIAAQLSDSDIPPPAIGRGIKRGFSGRWQNTTVRKILGNTVYIGTLVIYKQKVVDGKQVYASKDEHMNIPVPAIIDEKTFKRAQHLLSFKNNMKERRKRNYILTGMISCACGHAMCGCTIGSGPSAKPNRQPSYLYKCSAYNKVLRRAKCGNRSINAIVIENTVWNFVERLIKNPKTTLALYQKDTGAKEALNSNVQERIAAIDELTEENTQELRRLQRMYQRGGCDDQYFDAEKGRLDTERTILQKEREKAQALLDRNKNAIAQLAELEEIGEEVRSSLLGITEERKKRIYQRLRLHVTVEGTTGGSGGTHGANSDRHVVIEVLGHSERVRVKSTLAPSHEFLTSSRSPLMFRVTLLHAA